MNPETESNKVRELTERAARLEALVRRLATSDPHNVEQMRIRVHEAAQLLRELSEL
jgi:hypothetical protein